MNRAKKQPIKLAAVFAAALFVAVPGAAFAQAPLNLQDFRTKDVKHAPVQTVPAAPVPAVQVFVRQVENSADLAVQVWNGTTWVLNKRVPCSMLLSYSADDVMKNVTDQLRDSGNIEVLTRLPRPLAAYVNDGQAACRQILALQ